MSKRIKRWLAIFSLTGITSLLLWLFATLHVPFLVELENQFFDWRQAFTAPHTIASDQIVMVWLDEATMKELPYRSPVPRDFLTTLNEKILAAGPKAIGYDIFFQDPTIPIVDQELAKSFSKGPVYSVMPRQETGFVDHPLPLFEKSLKGVGLADLPFNAFDATVRQARYSFQTAEGETLTFAALLSQATSSYQELRTKNQEPQYIRFASPPHSIGSEKNVFKTFSAKLVAQGLVPASWLKDKIVLVGAAFENGQDAYLTPYYNRVYGYPRMFGVEIHAHILNQLLTNQFYKPLAGSLFVLRHILPTFFAVAAAIFFPVWGSILLAVFLLAGIMVSGFFVFEHWAWIVPIVLPMTGVVLGYALSVAWRAMTEGKEKRFIKGVFARYVPPAVVEKMTEHPEMLKLGGETRTITSFFTDIASFTTISEGLDPQTLVTFLNEYLDCMSRILFEHGGTLDKYEGDAIIALFNAPMEVAAHPLQAVKAALAMKRAEKNISAKWKDRCGREVTTRIGINTGLAVIGNMGSEIRFDYTAIGDTVNLAARLEGANKFYGTEILMSESTYRAVKDQIICRPLERVKVKGKTEPIVLYTPLGIVGQLTIAPEELKKWEQDFAAKKGQVTELTSK